MIALLAKRRFAIEHGGLIATGDTKFHPKHDNSDPRPVMIRIWMGTLLLAILAALIAVLAVLYNLSRTGRLSQALLVDQLNIDVLELSTTLTPYSIIPTLIAVAVKLWFRASAETFKRLQPFVSIADSPSSTSDSVSAEYANTPIALVSIKALKHSHWILALIGAGAFVTEAFTVGMSALWDPNEAVLKSVFDASLQNWLYGATIELTQSASTPPWSKDTWSFVPLDSQVTQEAASGLNSTGRNITFETPAIRARLECSIVDYASNKSAWLVETDFGNKTAWNRTNAPAGLDHGYYLNELAARGPGLRTVACCANETQQGFGDAVVGYWTDTSSSTIPLSMQAKWIVGRPLNESYTQSPTVHGGIAYDRWIWPEAPQIAAIDCAPIIEQAEASIIVDFETGLVYDYEILGAPQNATNAWTDFYFYHGADTSQAAHWQENITTSYGYIFWDSLLTASNAGALVNNKLLYSAPEDLSDGIFNFRGSGLNTDFMSYSMLAMANNSKEALLDPKTLMDFANKTFGIFFKHFASEEVNSTAGGRVYQPIGEKLPSDLGPVTYGSKITANQGALALQNTITPTPKDTQANLIIPIEQLIMSPIAFFLSISLLSFLILTTIIMYSVNRTRYKTLPRDVDTLASMIAFIHGSEKLLAWSKDSQHSGAWYRSWTSKSQPAEDREMKAQMGSFYDLEGRERWGIELVGTMNPRPCQAARNDSSEVDMQEVGDISKSEMQDADDTNVGGGDTSGVRSALLGRFDWEVRRKGAIRRKPVSE
ncbi:hypothetical protein D6D10_00823 [Aureobasidium pullulans]|uniref:Uncharacterized protein n=1 Tax=Aureobasidium pullulans TaxID=5580 RepID=A0A4S9F7Z2_AURPU|nr:hypothetical protein D6D10_00823 [Aureobasidium pullulans]